MNPLFPKIGQISMVVDDVYAYAKRWNDDYGIGPWKFLHFDKTNMTGMTHNEEPAELEVDIALCNMFENIELELLAPKDGNSALAEHLREHGPGLHHLAVVTPNNTFGDVYATLKNQGILNVQGAFDPLGQESAYMDMRKELGCFIELNDRPDDFVPLDGEEWYPPKK